VSAYVHHVSSIRLFSAKANHIHHVTKPFSSRIYSSSGDNNDEDKLNGGSLVDKAKLKVKSYIPFLKKDKKIEQSNLVKRKAKNDISSGIDAMLKDAPLAVRLMGKIISPIIGQVAGTMAKAMEEQSRQLDDCLDDARNFIIQDAAAVRELGEPVVVGRPFNQSSSSVSMNGQTKSNVQAQFEIQGSIGSGIATMNASDGKILSLDVTVSGQNYGINVEGRQRKTESMGGGTDSWKSQTGLGKNKNFDSNDVIDVEFTDKVKK